MIQIIEEQPTGLQRFGQGISKGMSENNFVKAFSEAINQNKLKENELQKLKDEAISAKKNYNIDLEGLTPELRKTAFSEAIKGQNLSSKENAKKNEELGSLQGALDRVNQMRQLRSKNNLGMLSGLQAAFYPETRKDRGEYTTLGNSLISFASSIPIRNRVEFEKLAGHISDPNVTDAEAEGILNALEEIIRSSLNQYGESPYQEKGNLLAESSPKLNTPQNQKERKPLKSFVR